jgi:hypothetical protein
MNFETIIATILSVIGALTIMTNIIVEVIKQLIPNDKFPTNVLACIVAEVFTLLAFFAYMSYSNLPIVWYYVAGAIVLGILVAYAAMFGFDKLKEVLEKLKSN